MTPEDSWYHVPKPSERVKRHSFQIERHGKTWSGSYTVEAGKLFVESAYGSRTVMVARAKDLRAKAVKVFEAIVDAKVGK